MPLTKIPVAPGIVKDDPNLSSEGKWIDGQWVRFRLGRPQTMGGWSAAASGTVDGICRGLLCWSDNDGNKYTAIGTHTSLYALAGGALYTITPFRASGTLGTDPIATTSGESAVTVTHTAHGLRNGDRVFLHGATAVGGLQIGGTAATLSDPFTTVPGNKRVVVNHTAHGLRNGDVVNISGAAAVGGITPSGDYTVAVVDADLYVITTASEATASATGGGASVSVKRFLPYTVTVTDANTYTLDAGSAASSTATGGGSAVLYKYEITAGNESAVPSLGGYGTGGYGEGAYGFGAYESTQARTWSLAQWGQNLLACPRGGKVYEWAPSLSERAAAVSGAPAQNNCVFVTAERFAVVGGTIGLISGVFDPLTVRWSDQANNTVWTPSATNLSGDYQLSEGTEIVAGTPSRLVSLIWTDTALYSMRYLGDIDLVYGFDLVATGCGLIGPKAFAERDGLAFWMSPSQQFYMYAGGTPEPIPCPVRDDVFDNLTEAQRSKVYCGINPLFNEVWWLYPRGADEVNAYVVYNWQEGHWTTGTLDRTAWVSGDIYGNPVAVSSAGDVFFHEDGISAAGSAIECYLEMAYTDIADGDRVMNVRRIVPDLIRTGGISVTAKAKRWPNDAVEQEKTRAFLLTQTTVDLRLQGRQIALRFSSNDPETEWRLGDIRVDMDAGGFR